MHGATIKIALLHIYTKIMPRFTKAIKKTLIPQRSDKHAKIS
jgi:hypothetical protein